jgi:hypothetical protein
MTLAEGRAHQQGGGSPRQASETASQACPSDGLVDRDQLPTEIANVALR